MRLFGVSKWVGSAVVGVAATVVLAAPATASGVKLTHSQATSRLSAAGVTWSSSSGCSTRSNPTCTSFSQINSGTIDGVTTLRRASGCRVNITGGTEVGHAPGTYSHYNGYKVDTGQSSCLDGYIKNSFTRIGNRGDGYPQWRSAAGNIYCDEGNHWDILYY